MKRFLRILLAVILLLALWIVIDVNYPYKTNIKKFDYAEVARLDGEMWRSYYEKKKLKLFFQSSELMRKQFGVPFWRSQLMAYHAAKAAFTFKDGKNRSDYDKALPDLVKYYAAINDISDTSFDVKEAARLELEWWVIRRYRNEHPPAEWENCLARNAQTVYHLPAEKFVSFAHLRVLAMLMRDGKENSITENDWLQIHQTLEQAWKSFSDALQ
ncbi:MAG: hypothetical protein JST75_15565 [Bacteroidetes bacterium]|nr:hypothetical protein [Bacteroidota bacterium]